MMTTYTWNRDEDQEVPIDCDFRCARYYPAVVHRLPDQCSPAEGGEVEEIEFTAGSDECTPELLAEFQALYHAGGAFAERVDETCLEHALAVQCDGPDY